MALPIFTLHTDHAAWRLDAAALTADDAGGRLLIPHTSVMMGRNR